MPRLVALAPVLVPVAWSPEPVTVPAGWPFGEFDAPLPAVAGCWLRCTAEGTPCALASGRTVASTHYGWQGEQKLDLWYDAENCWTALRAVTPSGEIISYERL